MDTLIIGIGNKARFGKDTFAKIFQEMVPGTEIIHWADALKDEVANCDRIFPLIEKRKEAYLLFNKDHYDILYDTEVPSLDNIFYERGINIYWGMDEKDSRMLQFWGTDYRRARDPLYWVREGLIRINQSTAPIVLLPDTRFRNEYDAIKAAGGMYVHMIRPDYIDPNRDPNHISETELDDVIGDYTIKARTGEIDKIRKAIETLLS